MSDLRVLAVIPARFGSTRLPGKVLLDICGKPMIQHVWERAKSASLVDHCIVATDDERVRTACQRFGAPVLMTAPTHASGTDRLAEVAQRFEAEIFVNVQGDEPLIEPVVIDEAIEPLLEDTDVQMSTLATRLTDLNAVHDPNVVKVVTDVNGYALYFSRAPIPAVREPAELRGHPPYLKHIGLYVYRREFLLRFANMIPAPLEKLEKLEQLRVLENGFKIKVATTTYDSVGVDTEADLERVRKIMGNGFIPKNYG